MIAPITVFNTSSAAGLVQGFAIVDLGATYKSAGVATHLRGFVSLNDAAAVLIVDELTYSGAAASLATVTWQMHTRATASATSRSEVTALASKTGVAAELALLPLATSCPGFSTWSFVDVSKVLPDPPFDSAAGITRVEAAFPDPAAAGGACSRIAVALGDGAVVDSLVAGTYSVRPMAQWASEGPFA